MKRKGRNTKSYRDGYRQRIFELHTIITRLRRREHFLKLALNGLEERAKKRIPEWDEK